MTFNACGNSSRSRRSSRVTIYPPTALQEVEYYNSSVDSIGSKFALEREREREWASAGMGCIIKFNFCINDVVVCSQCSLVYVQVVVDYVLMELTAGCVMLEPDHFMPCHDAKCKPCLLKTRNGNPTKCGLVPHITALHKFYLGPCSLTIVSRSISLLFSSL